MALHHQGHLADLGIPEIEVNIICLMHGYIVTFVSVCINALKSILLIYNFRAVYRILMYFISEENFYWEANKLIFLEAYMYLHLHIYLILMENNDFSLSIQVVPILVLQKYICEVKQYAFI